MEVFIGNSVHNMNLLSNEFSGGRTGFHHPVLHQWTLMASRWCRCISMQLNLGVHDATVEILT